ncbi:MAG: amidohydrolase family protein [Acidobacteriota bacterium]
MKIIRKILILFIFIHFFNLIFILSAGENIKYKKLLSFIEETKFIDVHSHPVSGHVKYEAKDLYPTLEPPLRRPFWVIIKERIAVFDSMQVEALKEIYGYDKKDVSENDINELENLSSKFWKSGNKEGFNRILDICRIEKVFSNSGLPMKDLDEKRVLWVPFVDALFYPLDPSEVKSISPNLKNSLHGYHREVTELSKKFEMNIKDLSSYLELVNRVLDHYKKNKAVALKVASGYIRTLWFDDVDEDEASKIFNGEMNEKISDWSKYKKLQDFIAKYIFLKAGELSLPVHFHTGFGANATLKNLDSNPLNLESIFSDMRFKDTKFVMLHAGYPFWDKLKPILEKKNAYVEFSAVNWFVYDDELEKILYEWLCYPGASEKIMFGSDAGAPVFFWIAAKNSRKALYNALSKLIDREIITEGKAILIAEKIMKSNALRLHNLTLLQRIM